MDFDMSRVYTAVNADQLKPGSKVFVADGLGALKLKVKDGDCPKVLLEVLDEDYMSRFDIGLETYVLAYLIEEPEALDWTHLKIGDTVRNINKPTIRFEITGIDTYGPGDKHVYFGSMWRTDGELKNDWERVEE